MVKQLAMKTNISNMPKTQYMQAKVYVCDLFKTVNKRVHISCDSLCSQC